MQPSYLDQYGLEPEYTNPEYEEVRLSEEEFLEPESEDEKAVLEILETGVDETDEWEPPEIEKEEFSYAERAAAHAYASATVTGFRVLEGGLKATFSTLEFLARRI